MTQQDKHQVNKKRSELDKFNLGFEFDRTWAEAKRTVQLRPIK